MARWSALLLLFAACSRAPLPRVCPDLEAGALAVSELRGGQHDQAGEWIELSNRSSAEISLGGVLLRLSSPSGSGLAEILVRSREVRVPPDGYVVLGRFFDDERPSHVDYGFRLDHDSDLLPDGIVEVLSCGRLIDRMVYRGLPAAGTLSFDGARALDAGANDDPAAFCVDGAAATDGGTGPGLGTPRARNRPCK